jgi:EF-P beta-lysylation protein EpmB
MKNSAAIIPVSSLECQEKSWKSELKNAFSSSTQLLQYLQLDSKTALIDACTSPDFPVRVPRPFAERMERGNPNDPLLAQVLATNVEYLPNPAFSKDPLNEQSLGQPGMLHKYQGRILLLLSGACAINCRYCFRRHFPYQANHANEANLENNLNYIRNNSSIKEVILSGGDPLLMNDRQLSELIIQLEKIEHLKLLRIHTRLPIVIPSRITEKLLTILTETRLTSCMVVHVNHPNEIDLNTGDQLQRAVKAGISVLNQSVLLKGVNNDVKTLAKLSQKLFEFQVLPYYLHILDPVDGSAHFHEPRQAAIRLIKKLRNSLPGYLVPRLAVELPGEKSKTILA